MGRSCLIYFSKSIWPRGCVVTTWWWFQIAHLFFYVDYWKACNNFQAILALLTHNYMDEMIMQNQKACQGFLCVLAAWDILYKGLKQASKHVTLNVCHLSLFIWVPWSILSIYKLFAEARTATSEHFDWHAFLLTELLMTVEAMTALRFSHEKKLICPHSAPSQRLKIKSWIHQ